MLKVEELERLEVGDQLDLPGLFPGLTTEPVVLHVTLVAPTGQGGRLTAEGRYFGVFLGRWTARNKDGSVEWRRQKPNPTPGAADPGERPTGERPTGERQ